jgi:hypothetical protein
MPTPQCFYGAEPIIFRGSFRTAPLLPEFVRECGDLSLIGRVSARFSPSALMFLLRLQVSLIGMLMGLPGAFMPGQMILLSVVLGAGAMGMGGAALLLGGDLL